MKQLTIKSDAPGERLFMLGNEAIARGTIEAGVQVAAAYPGTRQVRYWKPWPQWLRTLTSMLSGQSMRK